MKKNTNKILLADIETMKRLKTSFDRFEFLKKNNSIFFIESKNNEKDFFEKKFVEVRNSYLSSLKNLDQKNLKEKILLIIII